MTDRTYGGLYNVGSGKARTWNDLAAAIFAALGKTPRIDYIDMPESLRLKYQYHTEADMGWREKKRRRNPSAASRKGSATTFRAI